MIHTILSVAQVFIAVAVIFLVLLHSGKDAGMSGAFGVTRTNALRRFVGFSTVPTTVQIRPSSVTGIPTRTPRAAATLSVTATSSVPAG